MRTLLVLVLAVAACGAEPTIVTNARPRQVEAVSFVLKEFSSPGAHVPPIFWIEGDALDCDRGQGWDAGPGHGCVAGQTWLDDDGEAYLMKVAWPSYARRVSDSFTGLQVNLVHELAHSTFGPAMNDHPAPVFGSGGLVEHVSMMLRRAGL